LVLVINKLYLLQTTLQLTPLEAYHRLDNIIRDCNVVLSSYVNVIAISGSLEHRHLDPVPEDEQWFAPSKGNVVFASGIDGYGFSVQSLARTWAGTGKLGTLTEDQLKDGLWGEHYLDPKSMSINTTPKREGQAPMAVTFVFEPLWNIHDMFLAEPFSEERCAKVTSRLGVPEGVWKMARKAPKDRMAAVLGHWLPLATCLLDTICAKLPDVTEGQARRLPAVIEDWDSLSPALQCQLTSAATDAPVVVYVSKLIDTEYLAGVCQFGTRVKDFEASFIGFGRVYCGVLRAGMKVTLNSGSRSEIIIVAQLYILRGQGLEPVDAVLPGRLCGIGGIASYVTKHGVLTTSKHIPKFIPPKLTSASIVHYVLRPKRPEDLEVLLLGLKRLHQVDNQVELVVLPTGEYVMGVAGEVHAERCVEDLTKTFASVEFHVSAPIVQYRETIVGKATKIRSVEASTPCGTFTVSVAAVPFPDDVVEVLLSNANDKSPAFFDRVRTTTLAACKEAKKRPWNLVTSTAPVAIGPSRYDFFGCALYEMLDDVSDDEEAEDTSKTLTLFRESIVSGFQLAAAAGPMCEEPMFGVCFCVTDVICEHENVQDPSALAFLQRQVISTVATACRQAFQAHTSGQRLVEPYYDCTVYSAGATQGKIYNILNRRRAEIEDEVMAEGGETFHITCSLPVGESFGLQDELRIATSGAATAQLNVAHWSIIELDPFFKPTTKEEIEEYGTDTIVQNLASTIVENVRVRKGIQKRNVVEYAEKQKFSMRGT
jgi:translation elongation factor EF-G